MPLIYNLLCYIYNFFDTPVSRLSLAANIQARGLDDSWCMLKEYCESDLSELPACSVLIQFSFPNGLPLLLLMLVLFTEDVVFVWN
jgi:hypothetical protein